MLRFLSHYGSDGCNGETTWFAGPLLVGVYLLVARPERALSKSSLTL